ncbi:glycerophosphocholine cholinephosphodiesterase ENPP6-like [Oppia nitens]|uniref:glycerophosphocholine cholinephosphodiesterase ENPP6-like n=1 Tax=Oppia nitens TaxID=1686743 RepID=UPI0023DA41E3|nr:glycerophosphocholine cholinephosphodiesterase ENPP6-like [Oppia nitens]
MYRLLIEFQLVLLLLYSKTTDRSLVVAISFCGNSGGQLAKTAVIPVVANTTTPTPEKLLIILVNGFRWDYADQLTDSGAGGGGGFSRVAAAGVRAPYVRPIFPQNSYPNWYAIFTGRYPENYGHMYADDRETDGDLFPMGQLPNYPNVSKDGHWRWRWRWSPQEVQPVWITAEKNGRPTAMYGWDGCQPGIDNVTVSYCQPYRPIGTDSDHPVAAAASAAANQTRQYVREILDNFAANNSYQLALLYHEFVDYIGHTYGPESPELWSAVRDVDSIVDQLFDDLKRLDLANRVNVMIVSDHGMTQTSGYRLIYLNESIDFHSSVQLFLGSGSGARILPKLGTENEPNIDRKVYTESDGRRVPMLLAGAHGYDSDTNPDIRAIMYGFGPAFRRNYTLAEPLDMVDHYNLICRLLGLPAEANNGSANKIADMLFFVCVLLYPKFKF